MSQQKTRNQTLRLSYVEKVMHFTLLLDKNNILQVAQTAKYSDALISLNIWFFLPFEVRRRAERREREGEDPAFVCDTPPARWPLYLSSHCDPSHFSCPAIKRTGRNQRWPVTFRDIGAGVTWWWAASERAKSVSVNGRENDGVWNS